MPPVESYLPLISVCICLAGLLGVVALGKWPNLREAATLITGVLNLGTVVTMYAKLTSANAPQALECTLSHVAPGLSLAFRVDQFGLIFALVAATLWILKSIYAIGYMRGLHEHAQTRFFACFPIAIGSAMGMAYAGNLFTLFVFYEVLTISTYPLVFHHEDREAMGGVKRYLSILMGTSVGLQLPALVMLWHATGYHIDFGTAPLLVAHAPGPGISRAFLIAAFLLFVYGVGKAALMPMHGWLPAAMVAPTPVSSFLHAVAVVKAG
ncbi:MAG: proton-conducting transporter transmembrane domain-containing protein, partial [Planctomycetota bacterium]